MFLSRSKSLVAAVSLLLGTACGTTSASTPTSDAGESPPLLEQPPDGGTCNDLQPASGVVTPSSSADAPPPATGGPLTDGIYALASVAWYGTSDPIAPEQASVVRVVGTVLERAGAAGASNATFVAQGATLSLSTRCVSPVLAGSAPPDPAHLTAVPFSASPGSLVLFDTFAGKTILRTYARAP